MRKFVFAFCVGVMAATSFSGAGRTLQKSRFVAAGACGRFVEAVDVERENLVDAKPVSRRGAFWASSLIIGGARRLHGVARNGLATVYPITMGMASVFDDKLIEDIYVTVSDEGRAKFHDARRHGRYGRGNEGLTFWNPNVNIFRDPRWGRGQETWGEDPYLTTRMGVAVVRGMQGPADAKYDKTHACAKHYAVHSGPRPSAILSMWKIWSRVIYGKRIFRLSRRWCKRRM